MKNLRETLNKVLLYGFFLLGVILLFLGNTKVHVMILAFISFFASIVSAWVFKIKNINYQYLVFVNIALWLNLIGELYIYYLSPLPYDKLLHLTLGFFLAMIAYRYYKANSILKRDAVFLTVLGMLALWEIYEYVMDIFLGFQFQGVFTNGLLTQSRIDDTMMDLLWGSIGAVTYLLLKKEKLDKSIKREVQKIADLDKSIKREVQKISFIKVLKESLNFRN